MSSDAASPQGPASASPPRPTVVLACSGPEAGAIVEVARALIADGVRVDVVAGVDLDARPIELALEQHAPSTLWVLCRSEHLDEYQLELLLLTVRASEVPEEQVIALPYDTDATATFVALVRRRLVQLQWIAGEPGVPVPRPVDVTPVPTLTPEASGLGDASSSSSSRGVIAAALGICVCLGLGGWWWSTTEAHASAAPIATAPIAIATPRAVTPAPEPPGREPMPPTPPTLAAPTPIAAAPAFEPSGPIGIALAERRIRALDALLVANPTASATARRARKQCGKLVVAGVHAWRLPQPEELDALAEAGFLPDEGRYWTRRGKASRRAHVDGDRVLTRVTGRKSQANVLCVAVPKA